MNILADAVLRTAARNDKSKPFRHPKREHSFKQWVEQQGKFKSDKSGRKVLFKSLPAEQQSKIRRAWKRKHGKDTHTNEMGVRFDHALRDLGKHLKRDLGMKNVRNMEHFIDEDGDETIGLDFTGPDGEEHAYYIHHTGKNELVVYNTETDEQKTVKVKDGDVQSSILKGMKKLSGVGKGSKKSKKAEDPHAGKRWVQDMLDHGNTSQLRELAQDLGLKGRAGSRKLIQKLVDDPNTDWHDLAHQINEVYEGLEDYAEKNPREGASKSPKQEADEEEADSEVKPVGDSHPGVKAMKNILGLYEGPIPQKNKSRVADILTHFLDNPLYKANGIPSNWSGEGWQEKVTALHDKYPHWSEAGRAFQKVLHSSSRSKRTNGKLRDEFFKHMKLALGEVERTKAQGKQPAQAKGKKSLLSDHQKDLDRLGYTEAQRRKMSAETIKQIVDGDIKNKGVSILNNGKLQKVKPRLHPAGASQEHAEAISGIPEGLLRTDRKPIQSRDGSWGYGVDLSPGNNDKLFKHLEKTGWKRTSTKNGDYSHTSVYEDGKGNSMTYSEAPGFGELRFKEGKAGEKTSEGRPVEVRRREALNNKSPFAGALGHDGDISMVSMLRNQTGTRGRSMKQEFEAKYKSRLKSRGKLDAFTQWLHDNGLEDRAKALGLSAPGGGKSSEAPKPKAPALRDPSNPTNPSKWKAGRGYRESLDVPGGQYVYDGRTQSLTFNGDDGSRKSWERVNENYMAHKKVHDHYHSEVKSSGGESKPAHHSQPGYRMLHQLRSAGGLNQNETHALNTVLDTVRNGTVGDALEILDKYRATWAKRVEGEMGGWKRNTAANRRAAKRMVDSYDHIRRELDRHAKQQHESSRRRAAVHNPPQFRDRAKALLMEMGVENPNQLNARQRRDFFRALEQKPEPQTALASAVLKMLDDDDSEED